MSHVVAVTASTVASGGDHQKPQVVLCAAYLRVLSRVGLTAVLTTPVHEARAFADQVRDR